MTNLLRSKEACIDLLYEGMIVKLTWLQQPDDQMFQESFIAFLNFAREYKVKSLVSDNMIGINISLMMQRWIAEVCASYLPTLKVERYARIIPQDAFQHLVTYKVHDSLNAKIFNQVDVRMFTEMDMGIDWLLSEQVGASSNAAG